MKKKVLISVLIIINFILGVFILGLVGIYSYERNTICKYGVPSELQQRNDSLQRIREQIEQMNRENSVICKYGVPAERQRIIDSLRNHKPLTN